MQRWSAGRTPSGRNALATLRAWFRPIRLLLFCGAAFATVVVLGTAIMLYLGRNHELADATQRLDSLSLVLAEQTDRTFQGLDLVEIGVIDQMRTADIGTEDQFRQLMSTADAYRMLRDRIAALPYVDALVLIDRDGKTINRSSSWPVDDVTVTDRAFFRVMTDDPTLRSFLDAPMFDPTAQAWGISFTRKFTTQDGTLLGFIQGVVRLEYFERFYAAIGLSSNGSVSLFRRDGILLVRYPPSDTRIGRSFATRLAFIGVVNNDNGTAARLTSEFDGAERYVAARSVSHYPVVVTVSTTVAGALADWRTEARYLIIVAALLVVFVIGIVMLGTHSLRNQAVLATIRVARAEAETARSRAEADLRIARDNEFAERQLRIEQTRFGTALSNMSQALCMYDRDWRVVVANRQYARLLGLPESVVQPGALLRDLIERTVERGRLDRNAAEKVYQQCIDLQGRGVAATYTLDAPDGRFYLINHQPMEGQGWVSTYEDITDRRLAAAKIAHMAHHDALTDLPNRVLFRDTLTICLARARRGASFAVLSLDLDHFKQVNDTLGHVTGDALLQAVARRLLAMVRDTDTVARVGGDEFAVIQDTAAQPEDATALATRLIDQLALPYEVGTHQIVIGASVGIAVAPVDGGDPDELLKNADLALYRAKSDGRGTYRFFEPEMDARMQARRLLELDLRKALALRELEVHYQPMINLQTGQVSGCEALVRWRHPQRGLVPPIKFIPLAEEIGLIVPIGEFVLRRACADAVTWGGGLSVAVNLSPVQFRSEAIVGIVSRALRESGLPAHQLELEITETVMLQDTEMTVRLLHALRELGVRISMDDFGTGYSSLSYLRRFPFDKIKIDQSFVRDLGDDTDCEAIIRAVASLGHSLGMTTTAEGVETEQQLERLRAEHCTEVQGFLFSPARPAAEIPALLRRLHSNPACELSAQA